MTDIDRLTIVIASGFLMLVARLPESDVRAWGFAHLTFSLAVNAVLVMGLVGPVLVILGVWKP